MKPLILGLLFLISTITYAQDSIKVNVKTPKIITNLSYGKTLKFDAVEFKFVKVVEDSRCPKNVNCVRAGEVIVLIDVFEHGKFSEKKVLNFSSISQLKEVVLNLFSSEKLIITGLKVLPYPIYGEKINVEDYYIQFVVVKN